MFDPTVRTGFGCVWGIGTENIQVGFGVLLPMEEDVITTRDNEQAFDVVNGAVVAETFYRKQTVLRVRLYPGGATLGNAASANQFLVEPGVEITLVDTSDPMIDGSWVVLEQGKARRFDSKVYWDLTLRRHGNNFLGNSNQRLSATVG
jgi:hypothetical protein